MSPSSPNRRRAASILVVEDESIVRADVEEHLRSFGYRISGSVASGEEAKRQATKLAPDLVLMDILLEGKIDGIKAGKYIQRRLGIPVVFVTAHGDEHTLERAKLNAPFGYVLKPFNDRELRTAIEIAIFRHRTEEELRRLQQWLKSILDNMEEAVVVTDKWGFITLLNERAAVLTGWKPTRAVGKALDHVIHFINPLTRSRILVPLTDATLQTSNGRSSEQTLLLAPGRPETAVQFNLSSMTDSEGNVNGTILKFQPMQN